jgi:hypothetical protein
LSKLKLNTKQVKASFKELNDNFKITPYQFAKITGIPQTFIDKTPNSKFDRARFG